MDHANFPWRPLGALLVDEGLLTAIELEEALAEQQQSNRLLGQILVDGGYLTGFSLTRVLAKQHGIELRPTGKRLPEQKPATAPRAQGTWRPLGKLLVEKGFLTEIELDEALDEQRRDGGRLGEILVAHDHLSGAALARALAEQHGVDHAVDVELETVITPARPGQPIYQVVSEPSHKNRSVLYETSNFLEAADFACEFVEDHEPNTLEIHKTHGAGRETVWMYSESRAAEVAASRKNLVETFGFNPTIWDAGSQFGRDPKVP